MDTSFYFTNINIRLPYNINILHPNEDMELPRHTTPPPLYIHLTLGNHNSTFVILSWICLLMNFMLVKSCITYCFDFAASAVHVPEIYSSCGCDW